MTDEFARLITTLFAQRGFTLQKISPTTLPADVVSRHIRNDDDGVPVEEFPGILGLVASGSAFRCRIGKGRYWYDSAPAGAIEKALSALKQT